MSRPKNNPPTEKETIAPGIERITVGKGTTKRTRVDAVIDIASDEDINRFHPDISWDHPFEGKFDALEKDARKILESAGLPTNASAIPEGEGVPPPKTLMAVVSFLERSFVPPDLKVGLREFVESQRKIHESAGHPTNESAFPEGEGVPPPKTLMEVVSFLERSFAPPDLKVGLREFVESRGYRERECQEWYAAAFLDALALTRWGVRQGDAKYATAKAFGLGVLACEFRIRFGYVAEVNRKAGKTPKHIPEITSWVKARLKRNPNLKPSDLRQELSKTDDFTAIQIKGAKLYQDQSGTGITVLRKERGTGNWFEAGSIGVRTLEDYLKRARNKKKPPSRAK